jgi:hypothetical protein
MRGGVVSIYNILAKALIKKKNFFLNEKVVVKGKSFFFCNIIFVGFSLNKFNNNFSLSLLYLLTTIDI